MSALDDVQTVLNKIDWYQRQLVAIHRDESLTPGGRERQYFNMAESFELYGATAYRVFEAAWQYLKGELEFVARRRRAASQKFDDAWSFERLQYYHEQALADIGRSVSMQELEKLIRSVQASGSKEQVRAYLESSSAVLEHFRSQVGVGGLVKWMDDEAAKLRRPPEFDRHDEEESVLVKAVVKLRDDTVIAANMLPSSNVSEFLRQVHISMKADSVSGKYFWSVDFDEPQLIAPARVEHRTPSKVTP